MFHGTVFLPNRFIGERHLFTGDFIVSRANTCSTHHIWTAGALGAAKVKYPV
jgi:hypothetical protein